jgi:hypothetical protein
MTSTFEQSVYATFIFLYNSFMLHFNVICSLRYRIKIVLENDEDFC